MREFRLFEICSYFIVNPYFCTIVANYVMAYVFCVRLNKIEIDNLSTLSVPYEGYSRNASCALNKQVIIKKKNKYIIKFDLYGVNTFIFFSPSRKPF